MEMNTPPKRFDKKLLIAIALITAAAALLVAGLFVLPDTLVVQIGANGQPSSTMPRVFALLIPFALVSAGAWMYKVNDAQRNPVIIICVGFAVFIATFLFNLL